MIYIEKSYAPKAIQEQVIKIKAMDSWKKLEGSDTSGKRIHFDRLDKQILRDALIKEQHGLCAYCMRKITNDNSTTIEHFRSLSTDVDKNGALDYHNMLGVCDGGRKVGVKKEALCCDAAKGDSDITIDPLNKDIMSKIGYTKDGFIKVLDGNKDLENDVNMILHLNGERNAKGEFIRDSATQLVAGRKAAYEACVKYMQDQGKKYHGLRFANTLQKKIESLEKAETYDEYVGIKIYFLKKRLRASGF